MSEEAGDLLSKQPTYVLKDRLGYLERSMSWTCGRGGVEGNDIDPKVLRQPMEEIRKLQAELKKRGELK